VISACLQGGRFHSLLRVGAGGRLTISLSRLPPLRVQPAIKHSTGRFVYWSVNSATRPGRIVEQGGRGEGLDCFDVHEHMVDVCQMIGCGAIYDVVNDSDLGRRLNDATARRAARGRRYVRL